MHVRVVWVCDVVRCHTYAAKSTRDTNARAGFKPSVMRKLTLIKLSFDLHYQSVFGALLDTV